MKNILPKFTKSKKPVILILGCSFTNAKFVSNDDTVPVDKRGGWTFWGESVAQRLSDHQGKEYDIINCAVSGGSTRQMKEIFMWALSSDRTIEYVFVGGTDFLRFRETDMMNNTPWLDVNTHPLLKGMYHNSCNIIPTHFFRILFEPGFNVKESDYLKELLEKYKLEDRYSDIEDWNKFFIDQNIMYVMEQTLIDLRIIRDVCIANNIKFHYEQVLGPISFPSFIEERLPEMDGINLLTNDRKWMSFLYSKSHLRDYFKENTIDFPDWPFFNRGLNCQLLSYNLEKGHFISKNDLHPTAEGQRILADYIWKRYKKTKL